MNENSQIYTAQDLIDAREGLGLSRRAACDIAQVPYRIWTEWEQGCGYGTPPPLVFAFLNLYDNLRKVQNAFAKGNLRAIVYPCLSCSSKGGVPLI